jgi:hypothetical protein
MPDPSNDEIINLRTEYSELSRYFTEVIKYRFTVLGFLITAQAIILSNRPHIRAIFAFALLITFGLWVVDRRTRKIYRALGERAKEIEREWKGDSQNRMFHILFSGEKPYWGHSFGINIIVFALLAADLWMLL